MDPFLPHGAEPVEGEPVRPQGGLGKHGEGAVVATGNQRVCIDQGAESVAVIQKSTEVTPRARTETVPSSLQGTGGTAVKLRRPLLVRRRRMLPPRVAGGWRAPIRGAAERIKR